MKDNNILIVDPFSTGSLIAPILKDAGFSCFGVLSDKSIGQVFFDSYTGDGLVDSKLYSSQEIKQKFSKGEVTGVLAGAETGVYCAEALAFDYDVPNNDPRTSSLRRQKGNMQAQLAHAGLEHIPTQRLKRNEVERINITDYSEGYVLKPDNSLGTEDVSFYFNKKELLEAIEKLDWDKINLSGTKNDCYLIQERLTGMEFVVDLCVSDEIVHVCSLCKYKKGLHNGSAFVYESLEILDIADKQYETLIQYAIKAARTLGVEYGPAHLEIMLTSRGPVLIELGARLHGGIAPLLFERCYKSSLLSSLVPLVKNELRSGQASKVECARIIFLINEIKDRVITDRAGIEDRLNELPEIQVVKLFIKDGQPMELTTNLFNTPGIVSILAATDQELDRVEKLVRDIFNKGG